ncbi:MAG: putative inorganic carbon (HCO3(-)) transporter, partial [Candidatus Omnitrophota bacterium]
AEAVAERPILGHGPGAFRKIYGASTWSLHFKGTKQHTLERYAHNSYVEVLVGTGFLGLAVFLLIPVTALWDLTRARRCALQAGEEPLASMLSAGRAALFCLLIYLLIYSSVYDKFLWVGIALSQVVLVRMPQREQHI